MQVVVDDDRGLRRVGENGDRLFVGMHPGSAARESSDQEAHHEPSLPHLVVPHLLPRLDVHRLVHVVERRFGDLAGSAAALCHDVVQVCRVFTQSRARVPHRCHAFYDSIGDEFLAIDTADDGCPAFGINLLLNHRQ